MKKVLSIVFCAVLFLSALQFGTVTTNAAMTDEAEPIELGVKYSGKSEASERYFRFTIRKKSHITISYSYSSSSCKIDFYNASGDDVWKSSDLSSTVKYNSVSSVYKGENGKNFSAGTYYVCFDGWYDNYTLTIDAEDVIKLPKGKLSSVKSSKRGQLTMKCKGASNAIGYQFQYSTNERFAGKKKTVKSSSTQKTVKGLLKGVRYYVRVRPYTIYTDGTYVYGQFSMPKSIKIKK